MSKEDCFTNYIKFNEIKFWRFSAGLTFWHYGQSYVLPDYLSSTSVLEVRVDIAILLGWQLEQVLLTFDCRFKIENRNNGFVFSWPVVGHGHAVGLRCPEQCRTPSLEVVEDLPFFRSKKCCHTSHSFLFFLFNTILVLRSIFSNLLCFLLAMLYCQSPYTGRHFTTHCSVYKALNPKGTMKPSEHFRVVRNIEQCKRWSAI